MITILDVLQNAEYNLKRQFTIKLGIEQLHNATILLLKGYSLYEDFEKIMNGHREVDSVPEKIENRTFDSGG